MATLLWGVTNTVHLKEKNKQVSEQKVVNFAEPAELLTLDTTQEEDFTSFNAQNQVLEGLYQLDKNDEVIPAVASSLPKVSADKKTYTITLRKDAKWSNGTNVTASDFLYAWQRAVDPETAPSYASLFVDSIQNAAEINSGKLAAEKLSVEAPDEQTLVIHLIKPIPYFTSLLSFETFYPINQEFAEKQGESYGTSSATTLYNGAFTLTDWEQNSDTWSYTKNEKYWDAEHVKVDQINTSVVKSTGTAFNLYEAGELDRVVLEGEYAKQAVNRSDFQNQNDTKVSYLRFNQGSDKNLANVNLRKAISLAIDRESFVDSILGDGSLAATGFVPTDFTKNPTTAEDFRKESGTLQTYDASAAKSALAEAKKETGKSRFTLDYITTDADNNKTTAESLAGQIEQALPGVTINIQTLPSNNVQERYFDGDYDIAFGQWMPDFYDPITYLDMFTSDSGLNHINYRSAKYDQIIKAATDRDATNESKRWEDLIQAEKVLLQKDYVIAPIYQQKTAILQNEKVSGVVKHAAGSPYNFKYITVN
ncbi:MAG: peptide ABC transporter substrate-binding protein [Enterococcus sp.]